MGVEGGGVVRDVGVVRGVEVELASNFFDFCASQTSAPIVTRYHSNQ